MGMKEQEREWMERYIYQVTRRLPKAQRGETAMELRELIGDMAEEKGSVEAALTALGDPAVFAGTVPRRQPLSDRAGILRPVCLAA